MSEQDIPTADELRRRREELGLNTVQAAGTAGECRLAFSAARKAAGLG